MHAQLIFNLPEDQESFSIYYKAFDYYGLIETFRKQLRAWDKGDTIPTFEQVQDKFHELMREINYE